MSRTRPDNICSFFLWFIWALFSPTLAAWWTEVQNCEHHIVQVLILYLCMGSLYDTGWFIMSNRLKLNYHYYLCPSALTSAVLNGSIIVQIAAQLCCTPVHASCKMQENVTATIVFDEQGESLVVAGQESRRLTAVRQVRLRWADANRLNGQHVSSCSTHLCVLALWLTQQRAAFVSFTQRSAFELLLLVR